jgi:hypothetical protein
MPSARKGPVSQLKQGPAAPCGGKGHVYRRAVDFARRRNVDTLLYAEPIYLQAETAAYPELGPVAVMHNDNLGYAENLDAALRELLQGSRGRTLPAAKKHSCPLQPGR